MSDTFRISCSIQPQGEPLGLEIWLNDCKLFDQHSVNDTQNFESECADLDDQPCSLRFVLKNKQSQHTRIDSDNNIVSDSTIAITNVCFDEINIDQIVFEQAKYQHNFNGNGVETIEKFYGTLGCNGTVELTFTTPVYLWILENM